MNASELARVIESVGKDRGIKKEIIISALEQAVLMAAQKKYGAHAVLEAHYNNDSGEIDLFHFKKVVESEPEMLDDSEEIELQEARKLDPEAVVGDELGVKVETPDFGRIDAQTAKQVIFQKVRDAEREIVYNEYIHRKGEIITGIARRVERGNLVIDLGKTDALLPRQEIIPGEMFKPGDRVQAYLSDVVLTARGPQLYLTRTSPKYLAKLFEMEVPEIREAIVEIKHAAREPGARSKIAVISKDRDVDPVGACVGMKGIRVQNVIQELKGEKIDIIPWSDNPVIFVRSALAPAEISSIRVDERNRAMEIMVEDDQLSLAIGRKGQNVRLAAQLTGWKLDIISKTKLQKRTAEAIFNLQHIDGVNETLAHAIYQAGYLNVRQVAEATVENLQKVPGYDSAEAAAALKQHAAAVVEKAGDILAITPVHEDDKKGTFSAAPQGSKDAKTLAEERLREMMKQADGDSGSSKSE
ncbi:MAG: transcription termination factor NusA [Bdellovibrionales bacterium GWB1_52_6]|nr:MAG: transcription termination factor NusA [Bdellovibrionales bacterium GWB1_52_6]OFZ03074.1 MAG: transcription termination factor NusA [Bdellovibrionales bacterium GWA1_52_35]HCM40400.1 transcription termination/antitermination protein NusA [Bdellovibrionales bacterium]